MSTVGRNAADARRRPAVMADVAKLAGVSHQTVSRVVNASTHSYFQLFTGDTRPDVARRSLAVEPMTCPPNAFRTGAGVIRLGPGDRFSARWGIAVLPSDD